MESQRQPTLMPKSFFGQSTNAGKIREMERAPNTNTTPSIPSPTSTTFNPSTDPHHGPTFSPSLPTLCARSPTSPDIPVPPLAIAVADSLEPGSADFGPEVAAQGHTSPPSLSDGMVRSGAWNMRGFVRNDHCRLREEVI